MRSSPRADYLRRLTPLLTAAAVTAALLVPLAGGAGAQAPVLTKLNAEKEDADVPLGEEATITIRLLDATDTPFVATEPVEVDLELTGPNDPDAGFSPDTPDEAGCTIAAGSSQCKRRYDMLVLGQDTVWVWVNAIGADTSPAVDAGEGRNDNEDPGDQAEPDLTDVVFRSAFARPADTLDCSEKKSAQDGDAVAFHCQVDASVPNLLIDAENLGGANDPDDGDDTATADYDDVCVTDAFGACDGTIPQGDSETGSATICFWLDEEGDNSYHPGLEAQRDGSLCDAPSGVEVIDAPENDNITDLGNIGWGTARGVSLLTSAKSKKYGRKFTLRGAVTSSDTACESGAQVTLQRDVLGGALDYANWKTVSTAGNGSYSVLVTAFTGARYRALVPDDAACLGDFSVARTVRVKKKVSIGVSDKRVGAGQVVRITGDVAPCKSHKNRRVNLLRKKGGVWRKVASDKVNSGCVGSFARQVNKTSRFRVKAPKTGAAYEAGFSGVVTVRVG